MSQDQPQVFESRPSALTSDPTLESRDEKDHGAFEDPLAPDQVRAVVRLIQCRQCSLPLRDPITLPCGRSLCRRCLPEPRTREHISYPDDPDRRRGFDCPFPECAKKHASGDCSADVVLGKAINHFKKELERASAPDILGDVTTCLTTLDQRALTGIPTLASKKEEPPRRLGGGRLIATYTMAEHGDLDYDVDVSYGEVEPGREEAEKLDRDTYFKVKENVRTEMDCQVCYALFYDPLTTACGHTFCRTCLHRVLDHSTFCPICRRGLSISPLLHQESCPTNEYLSRIINAFWSDSVVTRGDALAAEALNRHREFDIPLFVCTLAFPMMPTFLHIFEPRYRLMIRRALEGDRTFGMVVPRRPRHAEDGYFSEYGTLLRIVSAEYFADGRSLIETQGISRFKVLRHGTLDGYVVGKIERIDDISLAEEEEIEARETQLEHVDTCEGETANQVSSHTTQRSETHHETATVVVQTEQDLARMSTNSLLEFALAFVTRMRQQSVPWLAQRLLTIYGECPNDAVRFPWWFASILPAKDIEKYRLLETTSVRERLKVCCGWVIEWETSRWGTLIDAYPGLLSQTAGSSNASGPANNEHVNFSDDSPGGGRGGGSDPDGNNSRDNHGADEDGSNDNGDSSNNPDTTPAT